MTKSNIYYVNSLQNPIYFINSLIIYSHFKFCEIEVQLPIDDIWLKTCFFFFLFLTHPEKKCAFQFMVYLIKCSNQSPLLRAHLGEATTVHQVGSCCFFLSFFLF